ncbi:Peptidase M16, N-terminal [Dillenia turbinata]|uniref:Peptidase M16, N-terminal n=1 Tax=Dillenia turbinata TaxID=194707 RepID=A0AAN8ZPG3_9MAGN
MICGFSGSPRVSNKEDWEGLISSLDLQHAGASNAYTASDHTNSYFDVNTDCFDETLDRFAQFFIKPLMSPDATTRAKFTIRRSLFESVLVIKLCKSTSFVSLLNFFAIIIGAANACKAKQLLLQMLCWSGNNYMTTYTSFAIRMSKFTADIVALIKATMARTVCNWDTLEVQPKAKALDTRNGPLKFYEENYSANLVHLVIYAKESLDKIQSLVEKFGTLIEAAFIVLILVKTVPIKQGHKLRVIWPITPSIHNYKEAPCRYLSHLIGHEGESSLFYSMETLGEWMYDNAFFKVTIELTDAGHEHIEEIAGFQYALGCAYQFKGLANSYGTKLLVVVKIFSVSIPRHALKFSYSPMMTCGSEDFTISTKLSAICETVFRYQDKISPIDYVVKVASNMQAYC